MPEHAYYISGHGRNASATTPSFIVPRGCVVVVMAHMGEPTVAMNAPGGSMTRFCALPLDVLTNPVEHKADLIDAFKSITSGGLAFYTEGQECPNFQYSLNARYFNDDEDDTMNFERYGSGVLSLNDIKARGCAKFGNAIDTLKHLTFTPEEYDKPLDERIRIVVERFSENYAFSVFPTQRDVLNVLSTPESYARLSASDFGTFSDIYYDVLSITEKHFALETTQKSLCTLFKGVFYNFVCRDAELEDPAIYHGEKYHGEKRKVRNSTMNYHSATEAQRAHMRAHISEAVLHRRPAIRNWIASKKFRATRARKHRNIPFVSFKGRRTTVRNRRKR